MMLPSRILAGMSCFALEALPESNGDVELAPATVYSVAIQ